MHLLIFLFSTIIDFLDPCILWYSWLYKSSPSMTLHCRLVREELGKSGRVHPGPPESGQAHGGPGKPGRVHRGRQREHVQWGCQQGRDQWGCQWGRVQQFLIASVYYDAACCTSVCCNRGIKEYAKWLILQMKHRMSMELVFYSKKRLFMDGAASTS